jgi:hypothetical protein
MIVPIGCQKSGIERTVVTGEVTYQGTPIENGEIAFVPEAQLPTTIVRIRDGQYRAEAKGGVPVGAHQVQIKAFRDDKQPAKADFAIDTNGKQYLSPRYNRESQLQANVEATSGDFVQDFHLK